MMRSGSSSCAMARPSPRMRCDRLGRHDHGGNAHPRARADGDGEHACVGRVLARAGRAWVHGPGGLLVVLDGAKGLRAAVRDVFGAATCSVTTCRCSAVSGTNARTS